MTEKKVGTIGTTYDRKNNFFDVLRFAFAGMVIYSHSYPLILGVDNFGGEIFYNVTRQTGFGTVAVHGFLVISGFLITQSIIHSKGFFSYMAKRLLRIMPAMIAATLLAAFIIGPLFTSLSLYDYFFTKVNTHSPLNYIFYTLTFDIFGHKPIIRDVFADNIYSPGINGSIWTLRHEFAMYLILALLFYLFAQFIKFNRLISIVVVIFLVLAFLKVSVNFGIPYVDGNRDLWIVGLEYARFVSLGAYFFSGAFLYLYKDRIVCSWKSIVFALAVLITSSYLNFLLVGMLITLPYIVISIGSKIKFSAFKRHGDFSYGLYIYAFPIQQSIMFAVGDRITHLQFLVMGFILTLATAFVSWKLIEAPCLKQKNRVGDYLETRFSRGFATIKRLLVAPSID